MAFENNRPIVQAVTHDSYGNPVAAVGDADGYRMLAQVKTQSSDGSVIDPATEGTLATRASEQTLDEAVTVLDETAAALADIRDSYGIKRITDPLPAGTNEIGRVAQGAAGTAGGAWPQYLVDDQGNVVGVLLEGQVYRIQTQSTVVHQTSGNSPIKSDGNRISADDTPFMAIGGYVGNHRTIAPVEGRAVQLLDTGQHFELMVADSKAGSLLEAIASCLQDIKTLLEGMGME